MHKRRLIFLDAPPDSNDYKQLSFVLVPDFSPSLDIANAAIDSGAIDKAGRWGILSEDGMAMRTIIVREVRRPSLVAEVV